MQISCNNTKSFLSFASRIIYMYISNNKPDYFISSFKALHVLFIDEWVQKHFFLALKLLTKSLDTSDLHILPENELV